MPHLEDYPYYIFDKSLFMFLPFYPNGSFIIVLHAEILRSLVSISPAAASPIAAAAGETSPVTAATTAGGSAGGRHG